MSTDDGASGARSFRVLVIDDHELLSTALQVAFAADGRAEVVATASSIAEGVARAAALRPDVILTDRRLPDGDMDGHLDALLLASPDSRVLLMTGWPTPRSSMQALDAGASGVISKTEPIARIIDAVGRVAAGEVVVPMDVARALVQRTAGNGSHDRASLSPRELDVLEALASGESTTSAAARLCMSHNTVRNHLAHAMLKLGVHDRLAAVAQAIRLGLVSPPMLGATSEPSEDPE